MEGRGKPDDKKQNALLQKVIATFGKVSGALSMWREWLNDIRRKQRSNSHDGSNDYTDRGNTEYPWQRCFRKYRKRKEGDVISQQEERKQIKEKKFRIGYKSYRIQKNC